MKYMKQIGILVFALLSVALSVESGYTAESNYSVAKITGTTTQTLELELDKGLTFKSKELNSDLKVYKDITVKESVKDSKDLKKVTLSLGGALSKGESYSILSISWVEWDIEFKTGKSLEWAEIPNSALEGTEQWIKKIVLLNATSLEVYFVKDIQESDLEFKVYKDVAISKIQKLESKKLEVILKDILEDNSKYVGTLTYLETTDLEKVEIEAGIYDFSTDSLNKYVATSESAEKVAELWEDTSDLEKDLLKALEGSKDLNGDKLSDEEKAIKDGLNAAGEDPDNKEKTQLEKLALSTGETPDTGAETWVLILGTFIINTFYYYSRRKKLNIA